MDRPDLYVILEVRREASLNDIKRAFRRLARRFHPDINPGDRSAEERFKRISEAYEVLGDPQKRQFYDENGYFDESACSPAVPEWAAFDGFDFTGTGRSGYSDVFDHLFRRNQEAARTERGSDIEHHVVIGFDDSIRGVRIGLSYDRKVPCGPCGTTGWLSGTAEVNCSACAGTGKVSRISGHLRFSVTCADCAGAGRLRPVCPQCAGEGRFRRSAEAAIEIPPGVSGGERLVQRGLGDAGRAGGPVGDLVVVVTVAPHPFFNRIGDHIHCVVPVTLTEAALGAKITVPTIDGEALLRVPPGTQSGQNLRLRHRGAPSYHDAETRGDQIVEVRVVTPAVRDERSKEILRELAVLNVGNPRERMWHREHHGTTTKG